MPTMIELSFLNCLGFQACILTMQGRKVLSCMCLVNVNPAGILFLGTYGQNHKTEPKIFSNEQLRCLRYEIDNHKKHENCLSSLIIMKLLALTFWTGSKSCFGIVLCLYTEIELKLRIFMGVLFTWPIGWLSSSWVILWIPLNFGKGTCLPAYIHSHHVYKSKQHDKTDEYVIATSFHIQHFSALQIHVLTNTGSVPAWKCYYRILICFPTYDDGTTIHGFLIYTKC